MLEEIEKYIEDQIEVMRAVVDKLLEEKIKELIISWETRFPDYEFQIAMFDLSSLRWKNKNDKRWVKLSPSYAVMEDDDNIITVIHEHEKFFDKVFSLEFSIQPSNFGWTGRDGEVV